MAQARPLSEFRFERLNNKHDCSQFTCGPYTMINNHLERGLALQAQLVDRQQTYLLLHSVKTGNDFVAGFYCLEAGSLNTQNIAGDALAPDKGVPPSLPVIYLAMIARHEDYRGQGLGRYLLSHAIRRSVRAADVVGAAGIYLIAITEEGHRLYREFGFHDKETEFTGYNVMFMKMSEARLLVNSTKRRGSTTVKPRKRLRNQSPLSDQASLPFEEE